jgi:hypothetical protein
MLSTLVVEEGFVARPAATTLLLFLFILLSLVSLRRAMLCYMLSYAAISSHEDVMLKIASCVFHHLTESARRRILGFGVHTLEGIC